MALKLKPLEVAADVAEAAVPPKLNPPVGAADVAPKPKPPEAAAGVVDAPVLKLKPLFAGCVAPVVAPNILPLLSV